MKQLNLLFILNIIFFLFINIIFINIASSKEFIGNNQENIIYGTNQSDNISAKNGDDEIYSKSGDDIIKAGFGNDAVYSQSGNDILYANSGRDLLNGSTGNDIFIRGYILIGGSGNDKFYITDKIKSLNCGSGYDRVYIQGDVDKIKSIAVNCEYYQQKKIPSSIEIENVQDDKTEELTRIKLLSEFSIL